MTIRRLLDEFRDLIVEIIRRQTLPGDFSVRVD